MIKAKVTLGNDVVFEASYPTLRQAKSGLSYQIPSPAIDNLKPTGTLTVDEYTITTSDDSVVSESSTKDSGKVS